MRNKFRIRIRSSKLRHFTEEPRFFSSWNHTYTQFSITDQTSYLVPLDHLLEAVLTPFYIAFLFLNAPSFGRVFAHCMDQIAMSDSSSDEESKERASQAKRPARKRRKLQPIEEGTSGVDDKASGVDGGGGILTEVSTDYGSKLRRAEKESYVKKSKLDMDAVKAPATRPRLGKI